MKFRWFALMIILFVAACGSEWDLNPNNQPASDGGAVCTLSGVQCVANSHCEGTACVCNAGFSLDGGVCVAVSTPDAGTNACGAVAQCPSNSHCENSTCMCNHGFTQSGNACVAVDAGTSNACGLTAQCPANTHCVNSQCICNAGFVLSGGVCVPAQSNVCGSGGLVCPAGFTCETRSGGGQQCRNTSAGSTQKAVRVTWACGRPIVWWDSRGVPQWPSGNTTTIEIPNGWNGYVTVSFQTQINFSESDFGKTPRQFGCTVTSTYGDGSTRDDSDRPMVTFDWDGGGSKFKDFFIPAEQTLRRQPRKTRTLRRRRSRRRRRQ